MKKYAFALALISTCLVTPTAYAYIDVSATTYIVQIVAGAVVVLGTVAGVAISYVKKKAKEKLGIDLEKKEQEEELVVYDEEASSDEPNK